MSLSSSSSPRLLFAVRLLLVAAAAAAVAVAFVASRPQPSAAATMYVCPMHPEVRSTEPGDCPICRMELEPVQQTGAAAPAAAAKRGEGDLVLPPDRELRRFDATALARPYVTSLEMRFPAWLETPTRVAALLHHDEVALLQPEEQGTFEPAQPPKDGVAPGLSVRLTREAPERWDRATSVVHFTLEAPSPTPLSAHHPGSLKLATRLRHDVAIPASALRQSPEGPYVFVVADDRRTLSKRMVEVGNVIYDLAAVIGGLKKGERVASLGTFLLEAEARLQAGPAR